MKKDKDKGYTMATVAVNKPFEISFSVEICMNWVSMDLVQGGFQM